MAPVVEELTNLGTYELGEAPHWDAETQSLYYVDIFGKSVHKYVPSTKKHTKLCFDKRPSFIIPVKGHSDRFVISLDQEIVVMTWDGESAKPCKMETIAVHDDIPNKNGVRINDGKADPLGNLWAGTMALDYNIETNTPRTGSFFCLSKNKLRVQLNDVCISNGLAWSKDSKKLYYIDTGVKRVDQFDYDIKTLTISNRQPLFTFDKHGIVGYPDGQTIDAEGNLWVAVFLGQRVLKIDTSKPETLLGFVKIPDCQVTSVCVGGPNLDEMYVTTAKLEIPGINKTKSLKGAIYKITGLGVKGLPGDAVVL